MHQRQVIRTAIVAILLNVTAAVDRVFPTRVLPFRTRDLPVVTVYTLEDNVDADSRMVSPRELTRSLSVTIEGWVAPGPNVDNAIDDLAEEIETAMHADPYLGGAAADSLLESTVMESIVESDRELGWVALVYDVTYRTDAPESSALLDDFNTANVRHNVGGDVHPDDEAVDSITVQV